MMANIQQTINKARWVKDHVIKKKEINQPMTHTEANVFVMIRISNNLKQVIQANSISQTRAIQVNIDKIIKVDTNSKGINNKTINNTIKIHITVQDSNNQRHHNGRTHTIQVSHNQIIDNYINTDNIKAIKLNHNTHHGHLVHW